MPLTRQELEEQGFIPKKGYKLGQAFPAGFSLPKVIDSGTFKNIPLYIQVRYTYRPDADGNHPVIEGN